MFQKLKVMRIFSLVMRDAPVAIGVVDLRYLEIKCGTQAIHHLITLFTSFTPSKLRLITTIEHNQLEIGVENIFLYLSYSIFSKLYTSTWVTHLWEFSHVHRLKICLPTLELPSSSCGNDTTLVDLLLNSGGKDKKFKIS